MKTLLALAAAISVVVVVVLAVTGALRVRNAGDEVHITIDKKEVKEKAEQAIDKTKHLGDRVVEKTREILHSSEDRDDTLPSETPEDPQHLDPSTENSREYDMTLEQGQATESR
jgi:hypothetical protein